MPVFALTMSVRIEAATEEEAWDRSGRIESAITPIPGVVSANVDFLDED